MLRWTVLASDYDGTLATQGRVTPQALEALADYRAAGGQVVLITGRRLPELDDVFPEYAMYTDRVVVENGGVLLDPQAPPARTLAARLPADTDDVLRAHGLHDCELGEVIVSTWRADETAVRAAAAALHERWPCQVVPNKDRVMVLPAGVDKASGLAAAAASLGVPLTSVVGIGDAENDAPLLTAAGLAVAVANSVETLMAQADRVTHGRSSAGVVETIRELLRG
jgi:hypothetical protein